MVLQRVVLPELIWPCWAYALARIGKRELLTFEWVHEIMPDYLRKIGDDTPSELWKKPGTVIVWSSYNSPETNPCFYRPVELLANGVSVCRKVRYDYHAGVYEQGDVVSDMVLPDSNELPFIIRQRRVEELPFKSVFFLPIDSPAFNQKMEM